MHSSTILLSFGTFLVLAATTVVGVDTLTGSNLFLKARILGINQSQTQKRLTWTVPTDALPGSQGIVLAAVDAQANRTEQKIMVNVQASQATGDTILHLDPAQTTVPLGKDFSLNVLLDSPLEAAAAIMVDINFSDTLTFIEADAQGSVFDEEALAATRQGNGLKTARVALRSDYQGTNGQILKLTFQPKATGEASITINSNASQVISRSGLSNILDRVVGAAITIENRQLCVQTALDVRTDNNNHSDSVAVTITDESTDAIVGSVTVQSDANGKIIIVNEEFLANLKAEGIYTIIATPEGYLAASLPGVKNILDGSCHIMPTAIWGDFNANGSFDIDDMKRVINFYRANDDELLSRTFGGTNFGLIDLVRFIGSYRSHSSAGTASESIQKP